MAHTTLYFRPYTAKKRYRITVSVSINAPVGYLWKLWNSPGDIMNWNHAGDDWQTTRAENDLRPGGKFLYRMEARDGSAGFDFSGKYEVVKTNKKIVYRMDDGRRVEIVFTGCYGETLISETVEAEDETPIEIQRNGWQAILNNFRKYSESH